ncbi:hypothetical protein B0H12DRAFT_1108894 [Mycena haematopus]|nr:hypothetical protein B0H12DRAFT_1108894 [Mycena haematopus]
MTSSCRPLAKQRLPQARITQEWHNGRSARPKEPPYGRRWILVIAERVMTSRRSGVREEVTVVAVDVDIVRARAYEYDWDNGDGLRSDIRTPQTVILSNAPRSHKAALAASALRSRAHGVRATLPGCLVTCGHQDLRPSSVFCYWWKISSPRVRHPPRARRIRTSFPVAFSALVCCG